MAIVGIAGLWRVETTANRAESTTDALDEIVAENEAQGCVRAWDSREQLRQAIPIPAEALIEVVSDADPATVDAYRAAVARRIAEAYPDPECSLAEAQAQLDR
jgi:hypothetical protein